MRRVTGEELIGANPQRLQLKRCGLTGNPKISQDHKSDEIEFHNNLKEQLGHKQLHE